MKKIILAAAAMMAALTVNAQVMTDVTLLTGATLSSNFSVNGSNLDYTGDGSSAVEATAALNSNLTIWYKGNKGDKSSQIKGGDDYIRTNGKDCGLIFSVPANEQVSVVVRAKGGTAPSFAVEQGTGITMPAVPTTKTDGKSYDEVTLVVQADASGNIFLNETAGGFDILSYTIGGTSAVNEAAAEGAKEVVARVGLVNVYNDGSKELAK